ncbi:MAG: DUF192 domain-containing protein [Thermomicrobiales bacterium]
MLHIANYSKRTIVAENAAVASSPWSRFRGLMLRSAESFQDGQALVIDPCTSIRMFFMRFPIDVLYLSRENEVVRVQRVSSPGA